MDWAGVLVGLVIFGLPSTFVVLYAWRPLRTVRLDRIAAAWGAGDSRDAREMVGRYLRRSERFRAVGFAIGWSFPFWSMILRGTAYSNDSPILSALAPLALVIGVSGGIVAHEATYRLTSPDAVASISRRSIRMYLNRWQQYGPLVFGGFAAGLVVASLAMFDTFRLPFQQLEMVALLAAMIAVVGGASAALRSIVDRRQNLDDPRLLAVDDSSRRFGAVTVSRAAFAAVFTTIGTTGMTIDYIGDPAANTWLPTWIMLSFTVIGLTGMGYAASAAFARPLDVGVATRMEVDA